jgi:hypothetical protein
VVVAVVMVVVTVAVVAVVVMVVAVVVMLGCHLSRCVCVTIRAEICDVHPGHDLFFFSHL